MNQPNQNINPDRAAANLAFVTHLSEGLLPQGQPGQGQPQEAPQMPETAPQQAETPQPQETAPQEENKENEQITTLTKDMSEFKGKIEGLIESKFNDLTKTITDALKS